MQPSASPPGLPNRAWPLCILSGLLAFFFLSSSSSLNQRWRPNSLLISLPPATPTTVAEPPTTIYLTPSPVPSPMPSQPTPFSLYPPAPPPTMLPIARAPPSLPTGPTAGVVTVKPVDGKCNIFDGRWVYDPSSYPLYYERQCPFLSDQVACRRNGRPDSGYQHWRWEPNGCNIPRLNGSDMLERMRGKRVVIIGDSLNRNQWESLVCLLYSAVDQPSRTQINFRSYPKIFRAMDYGCSVEFYWSPFLVALEGKEDARVLKLEKLSGWARRWRGNRSPAVVVFNSGHWWMRKEKDRKWRFIEHKGQLIEGNGMAVEKMFEVALEMWARWVDRWVDPTKTTVFFRSISPRHIPDSKQWCYNQINPITNETYVQWFPSTMISIVEKTIRKMKTPVKYLNITRLSEYRRDAHAAVYTSMRGKLLTLEERRNPKMNTDCNHWCLPGVPDTWNVLMYLSTFGSPSIAL